MTLAFVQLTVALTSLPQYAFAQCVPDAGEGQSDDADPNSAAGPSNDGQSEFSDLVGSGNNGGDDGGDAYDGGGDPTNVAGTDGNGLEQTALTSDTEVETERSGNSGPSGGSGGGASLSVAGALASGKAVNVTNRGGLTWPVLTSGSGGPAKSGNMENMGDPIDLKNSDKVHVQVDYVAAGAAAVRMARVYHSNTAVNTARVTVPMGTGWHMVYDRSLQVLSATQVRLHRANGRTLDLTLNGGAWASAMPAGVLSQVSGGWQYVNHRDAIENYDATGRLLTITKAGLVVALQYDTAGRLIRAVNPFGRALGFGYDVSNRLATLTLPDGNTLGYAYDTRNNLVSVRFADNSTRLYAYESAAFPNALTGVVDESGRRRLTWGYDSLGRPNMGYYGANSNAVSAVYNGNQVTTTDARGTQRVRTFANIGTRRVMTSISTAATADSAATGWNFVHDSNGNPLSVTTRSGEVQQFGIDTRGRAVSLTRAAGTLQALSQQAQWHPTFRKVSQVVASGVTSNFTVDSAGRTTLVTQTAGGTTTIATQRVYNAQNLLQSVTDARGATTTFAYDTAGNRSTVTDPLGRVSYFQNYDVHGQATRIQRADGTIVTRAFDTRGRLVSTTDTGLTTTLARDLAGRITRVNRPDGAWRSYSFDTAGVMTGTTNHRGESSTISRDVDHQVTNHAVYSATGAVAQVAPRQFNAVGQVAAVMDSRNYRTQMRYAADGRPNGSTDPLGLTTSVQLDPLNRVTAVTQPNTTAMRQITGNSTATSTYGYDARGNHNTVSDTKAVATTYAYNAQNFRSNDAGTDAGTTSVVRNAAGEVTATTDARGNTLTIGRDAIGRIKTVTPTAGTGITYTYVSGRSDGVLSQMTDASGTTAWAYDPFGGVLSKQQTIAGVTRTVSVVRDGLSRPTSITYPSGMRVDVGYTADVLSSLTVNGTALLNGIAYRPYSQTASSWRWGNGSSYARSFDADGRVTSVTLGSATRTYAYDPASRVSGFTDTGTRGTQPSSFTYDEAGQLTGYSGPGAQTQGFAYDTNANRRSEVINGAARAYAYEATSNRLLTVAGTRSYQYNSAGQAIDDGAGLTFGYNVFGRFSTMTSAFQTNGSYVMNFGYNGLGQRVTKKVSIYSGTAAVQAKPVAQTSNVGTSTVATDAAPTIVAAGYRTASTRQFVYDDAGHLLGEYDSTSGYSQETVWFNGQPVATVQGGVVYYINADHLGTPRSAVRASDNVEVWRWDSGPFGSDPATQMVANTPFKYNLRFPGQYLDEETSLHYNGMRDYDPYTGRYIQADLVGLEGGLSRYAYVSGNPLNFVDPSGLWVVTIGGLGSFSSSPATTQAGGGFVLSGQGLSITGFGTYQIYGAGPAVGEGGSFGASFSASRNATSIGQFGGPFVNGSVGVGLGPYGSIDVFKDLTSPVAGGGFTIGIGVGGGISATTTQTTVTPIWVKPPSAPSLSCK